MTREAMVKVLEALGAYQVANTACGSPVENWELDVDEKGWTFYVYLVHGRLYDIEFYFDGEIQAPKVNTLAELVAKVEPYI